MNLTKAMELNPVRSRKSRLSSPSTNKPIYLKVGRFGPYIQLGEDDDEEKRNQSILKTMQLEDVTVEGPANYLNFLGH